MKMMTRYTHTLRSDDLCANEMKIQHSQVLYPDNCDTSDGGFGPATHVI
jgi:hypothetical protein